ncbi:MAG TPA: hypothetical protein VFL04_01920 [Rectinemataceae bacterium]|nr:hypothetical protein [Rectinemataceae bacterium]
MKRPILAAALSLAALLSLAAASNEGGSPDSGQAGNGSYSEFPTVESLNLHLKLAGMARASAPAVVDGYLVLSARGPYRFVGAAFAHEGFAAVHAFKKNAKGVFVLAYKVPLKRSEALSYRLVIDGVWTWDPANPRREMDPELGLAVSLADVPYLSDLHLGLYELLDRRDGRTANFIFRAAPGESVTVSGDFDNWDPFIHEMSETSPGVYELSLPLTPGTHLYGFVYRGSLVPDPLNVEKASNREGKIVSVISVGQGR